MFTRIIHIIYQYLNTRKPKHIDKYPKVDGVHIDSNKLTKNNVNFDKKQHEGRQDTIINRNNITYSGVFNSNRFNEIIDIVKIELKKYYSK